MDIEITSASAGYLGSGAANTAKLAAVTAANSEIAVTIAGGNQVAAQVATRGTSYKLFYIYINCDFSSHPIHSPAVLRVL